MIKSIKRLKGKGKCTTMKAHYYFCVEILIYDQDYIKLEKKGRNQTIPQLLKSLIRYIYEEKSQEQAEMERRMKQEKQNHTIITSTHNIIQRLVWLNEL